MPKDDENDGNSNSCSTNAPQLVDHLSDIIPAYLKSRFNGESMSYEIPGHQEKVEH